MQTNDYLFVKSDNIWFGLSRNAVSSVRLNQKPGWFPIIEDTIAGIFLFNGLLYNVLHLNSVFGGKYKPFAKAHMIILKTEFGNTAIACQEIKTHLKLPMGSEENIEDWINEDYVNLYTHWFPVNLERFSYSLPASKE
jgi:hypothetical protein